MIIELLLTVGLAITIYPIYEASANIMEILNTLKVIQPDLRKIAGCVRSNHHRHGDQDSISTKDWNC